MTIDVAIAPDRIIQVVDQDGLSGYKVYTWPHATQLSSANAWMRANAPHSYCDCEHDCCGHTQVDRHFTSRVGRAVIATQYARVNV